MEKKYRLLSLGAHPDDADTSIGGLLGKLEDAGWEIRMLSITDGSAGTYHLDQPREEVARIRKAEAARSGALSGGRYDVWEVPDGQLEVTLELRERLIRYIREFRPDVIITNRPNDYHPDHRNCALLLGDASFLLTVPRICDDVPYMEHAPTILYWGDDFKRPYPFRSDILCPVSAGHIDRMTAHAACHECQYFDWMYWPDNTELISWPREKQIARLNGRFRRLLEGTRAENDVLVREKYGADAEKIKYLETFEICEYSGDICEEFLKICESVE